VSWLVRQVDLALALLESDLSSGACVHLRLGRSPCKDKIRLDFICVSCLGFLLRTREHLISSTLYQSLSDMCGAALRILGVPLLLIVVHRGRGWKNYLGFGLQSL